jgi:hypothetical protein
MRERDTAKREQFRIANDLRMLGLARQDVKMLEQAVRLFEDLGCRLNARKLRERLEMLQWPSPQPSPESGEGEGKDGDDL